MPLLSEKVIESLRQAGVPALEGCKFDFGNNIAHGFSDGDIKFTSMTDLGQLYQNDLVRLYSIMTEEEF